MMLETRALDMIQQIRVTQDAISKYLYHYVSSCDHKANQNLVNMELVHYKMITKYIVGTTELCLLIYCSDDT